MLFKHYFYEVADAAAAQNLEICFVAKEWDVIECWQPGQQCWALHRNETLPLCPVCWPPALQHVLDLLTHLEVPVMRHFLNRSS